MRELAILTFVTLDGVMQAPAMPDEDRSGGFANGGWATPYWEEVMSQVGREAMAEPYDMLFGRKTYDLFAAHWPEVRNDPAADRMNAATKYVATSSPDTLNWANSHAVSGDVAGQIAALKKLQGPLLQVHGSSELVHTLIAEDLVDEFRLWIFPTLVGPGKRLFRQDGFQGQLQLVKSEACRNGVVMNIYRRDTQR
ncbi:dihydrofolate reductase family protein [Anderseniella sp. Alg231-50]|uniref:dihydrofolate reductase family protein n=1 Tax=Anderseniella sp. Alg231-50 TaxID=1922226 RepID=UPI000D54DC2C